MNLIKINTWSDVIPATETAPEVPSRIVLTTYVPVSLIAHAEVETSLTAPDETGKQESTRQLMLRMNYKVIDYRRSYRKRNGRLVFKDNKPIEEVIEVEDYQMYLVHRDEEIDSILKVLDCYVIL